MLQTIEITENSGVMVSTQLCPLFISKQSTFALLFQIESLNNNLRSKTSLRDWLCNLQNLAPETNSGFLDKLSRMSCHDELLSSRTAAINELVIFCSIL